MKHSRLQINVLLVLMATGAMGPPLIGPVRERLQAEAAISRASLGLWVFALGTAGAAVGLAMGVLMRRTVRTTFMRIGTATMFAACALVAATEPGPGAALLPVGFAWFLIMLARPMAAASNGIFADLWDASPHTGVIILHALNSLGKVLAPVVVLLVGTAVRRAGLVYAGVFGLLAAESLFWPHESVRALKSLERSRDVARRIRLPRDPLIWAAAVQFAFITGAEAGATAILGSLVQQLRAPPATWLSPERWPAAVILVMLLGILAGRVVFAVLSLRLTERRIIAACLACGVFAVPGAFSGRPLAYLPCLFLTGVTFSATWPAFYGLVARLYPAERTFLGVGAAFFTALGASACVYLSSAIGNAPERLPLALVVSVAVMIPFAAFLFLSPVGRGLGRGGASGAS